MQLNLIGIKTLYIRDVMRFLKVYNQTIVGPIISAGLYYIIFSLIAAPNLQIEGVTYQAFLISGLAIMSAINNAFSNGAAIIISKMTGNITDLITAPFRPFEIVFALTCGAVTRSVLTCIIVYLVLCLINQTFFIHNLGIALLFLVLSSIVCALVGILTSLVSDSFDEASIVSNFFITPLMFLSGTFYDAAKLPPIFQKIIVFNPFFYMIDGFRYGILGVHEKPIGTGITLVGFVGILLFWVATQILKTGYKLRK